MGTITVRELRQNPTEALRAVEREGAEFTVTNHNRPVARLVPLAAGPWVRVRGLSLGEGGTAALARWRADRDDERLDDDREPRA